MKKTISQSASAPIIAALAALALLSGCGASSSKLKSSSLTPNFVTSVVPSPTPSTTPNPQNGLGTLPLYQYRVEGVGYYKDKNNTTESAPVVKTVFTKSILKIRFTPGVQDQNAVGTGFQPKYSKLGAYIKVGDLEIQTPMLGNGESSSLPQEQSQVYDFSSVINTSSSACATSTDPNCRFEVQIQVSKPSNDFYCYNGYYYWCPYLKVYYTHPWNAQLEIQTDDTVGF